MPRRAAVQTEGLVRRENLLETLATLREAGEAGITRMALMQKLGTCMRTVDRALALLEQQGARLDRVKCGQPLVQHLVLRRGPGWDEHVTPSARLALRLAGISLSQSGTMLWQEKLDTLEELAADRMSHKDRRMFEHLVSLLRVQGGVDDPIETPNLLEPLLRALEEGREIEVDYQAVGAPEPSTRTVVPYAMTHDLFSGGCFLLVWDLKRKAPIHLRLNRIGAIKVGARPGLIPDKPLMDRMVRYQIGGWASPDPPFEVSAVIHGPHWVQAFKEAPPALPDFEADRSPDGQSVKVRFKANHPYGALRWLLQFGASAQVLGPEWLKENIRQQHAEALGHYDG
ncbi:MAG: WYL domain-containing protein [Holophaga sp.]